MLVTQANTLTRQFDDDYTVLQWTEQLFAIALEKNASDIHCEPFAQEYRTRLRVDGLLYEYAFIPLHLATRLITRFKVLAGMDIAEKRLPQDGHLQWQVNHLHLDCRMSTFPTIYGEKLVIRLLNPNSNYLEIDELGMSTEEATLFRETLRKDQGLILVTGPTGSGKTCTLYAALSYLNSTDKNISSIEDPVEIQLIGINQLNINPKAGLTFAFALRALLRQDPDVIMIGEIRDFETADIALKAAQTGHLVLATVHSNGAIETINRFCQLGIAPLLLADSLSLIIAQRLVPLPAMSGRTGQFEFLSITPTLREQIAQGNVRKF